MKSMVLGGTDYLMLGILEANCKAVTSILIIGGEPMEDTIQMSEIRKDWFGQAYFIRNGCKYHPCQFI